MSVCVCIYSKINITTTKSYGGECCVCARMQRVFVVDLKRKKNVFSFI